MKKRLQIFVSAAMTAWVMFVFVQACSTKSDPAPASTATTYSKDILPLMGLKCTPCHFPRAGGFKKVLDNYQAAKSEIDEIIRRINLDPADTMSMPYLQFRVLSVKEKELFQKWKDDGLIEK